MSLASNTCLDSPAISVVRELNVRHKLNKWTGLCAGLLVATYITLEAPISGMSMNAARSLASAVPARHWADLWIYFTAPVIGMLSAAEVHLRVRRAPQSGCAKLHHENSQRCIFCGKPAA